MAQSELWRERVIQELLPQLNIQSLSSDDPVEAIHIPVGWSLMGLGNYAAVLYPDDDPRWVVKVYAEGRPGLDEEVEVYRRLGSHPTFPECYGVGANFLILNRLSGINLYNCLLQGVFIPKTVIEDVDIAMKYAKSKGLNPRDIHGKNILNHNGRGFVVDVSDFLLQGPDHVWEHTKWAYRWIYRPFFGRSSIAISEGLLETMRKAYRKFVKMSRKPQA